MNNSMETQKWTNEELCQVYDLQHGYEKVLVDFVRHEASVEVNSLMGVLPLLYGYEGTALEPNLFQSSDVSPETAAEWKLGEDYQDHDYIYRDVSDEYKTADDLREVSEGTFQHELGVAHPEILAVLGNDYPKAKEHYSRERFNRIRATLPERFQRRMDKLMENYPEDIREKAMETEVYGCVGVINRTELYDHARQQETEHERCQNITEREDSDTIVAAYDLQMKLTEAVPGLSGADLTETVHDFHYDPEEVRKCYGSKAYRALNAVGDEVREMASKVDFVHTEERLPVLENHKICLYGTEEEKIALYLRDSCLEIANSDAKALFEVLTDHYEKEGFARRYVPMKGDPLHFADKTFKVIGRAVPEARDFLPHWEIDLGDGKPVRASANEIISSAIPELQRRLYLPDPTPRKLEEAVLQPEERKSVTRKEAEKKLSQLLQEFQKSGVKANGIMELLNSAGRKLQAAQGR